MYLGKNQMPSNHCWVPSTVLCNCHCIMGVAREELGPWSPKYIISSICLSFCQFYKRVTLRLSGHVDDIETQSITCISPLKFFSKLGTWFKLCNS